MSTIVKGVYNQRRPEQEDYYQIIEQFYEDFIKDYPETLEAQYGWLREEVINAIHAFLDSGNRSMVWQWCGKGSLR